MSRIGTVICCNNIEGSIIKEGAIDDRKRTVSVASEQEMKYYQNRKYDAERVINKKTWILQQPCHPEQIQI